MATVSLRLRSRAASAGAALVAIVACTAASGETLSECQRTREDQRPSARAESDRDQSACRGDRACLKEARARSEAALGRIDADTSACRARARAQARAEPPPYLNWKPGDPPPVAKDGRRYLMSCSGKDLGLYKPGGAPEVELKQHKGNCLPQDD